MVVSRLFYDNLGQLSKLSTNSSMESAQSPDNLTDSSLYVSVGIMDILFYIKMAPWSNLLILLKLLIFRNFNKRNPSFLFISH